MSFEWQATKRGFGATISGLQLHERPPAGDVVRLKRLLAEQRVLFFPGQRIDDDNLVDLAHMFGPPFVPDAAAPVLGTENGTVPQVVVIGNRADDFEKSFLGHQDVLPHSDHQWVRCPSSASFLYAVDVPKDPVSTTWIDLVSAYRDLDSHTKQSIDGLQLATFNPFFRPFGTVSARYVDRAKEVPPGPVFPHPLVRTHPDSGERILFINCAYEVEIVGMDPVEGDRLMRRLQAHVMQTKYQYEHRWENGDLVLWDNQCTLHFRHAFDPSIRRVLKRVSLGGGRPF